MTVALAPGLYLWTLTLADGRQRVVAGSSIESLVADWLDSPVVSAVRGAALVDDPTPVVGSLTPATAKIGDPNFTLHVIGTGFRAGCQIFWNGSPEPTTLVSPTELTTGVDMATAQTPMSIPVFVRSIAGQDSNVVAFALTL